MSNADAEITSKLTLFLSLLAIASSFALGILQMVVRPRRAKSQETADSADTSLKIVQGADTLLEYYQEQINDLKKEIASMREEVGRIPKLEAENASLKSENARLQSEVESLRERVNTLENGAP